jgi:hypothetical protein
MEVAVAIARIKGFYRDGDQKIALPLVTDPLAARSLAYAVGFVQRV